MQGNKEKRLQGHFKLRDQSGIKKHFLNWSISQWKNMILEQTIMAF